MKLLSSSRMLFRLLLSERVCRNWHLEIISGCRGFIGPVPLPLWIRVDGEDIEEVPRRQGNRLHLGLFLILILLIILIFHLHRFPRLSLGASTCPVSLWSQPTPGRGPRMKRRNPVQVQDEEKDEDEETDDGKGDDQRELQRSSSSHNPSIRRM